jgi:hypothetical protein
MDKFTQAYTTCCELAVKEVQIGFKGRLFLKKYLPGKPTKWAIKSWGLAESANSYLLKCDICKGKKKFDNKTFYWGNNLHYNLQKICGENGIIFISTKISAPQILRKCYCNKKFTAVALQEQIEKLVKSIYETNYLDIEKGRVQENAAL